MKDWTNEELQHLLTEVARRATVDLGFRFLALKDSASAIAQINSKPLPVGMSFRFVDNSGPAKTIPLPDLLPTDCEELSEAELEGVAGGETPPPPPPVSGGWNKIASMKRQR